MRVCEGCGQEFHPTYGGARGCSTCRVPLSREAQRAGRGRYRGGHREAIRARNRAAQARRYQLRSEAIRQLKQQPCVDCGVQFHFAAMEFDHVRGDKISNLAQMVTWGWQRILVEVA